MAVPSVIAVHGGAGTPPTPSNRRALRAAAREGAGHLGVSALAAVVEAVALLEASGRFNAGRSAYLDLDGVPRVDASVMVSDGRWGAVASAPRLLHPVRLARVLLERTGHALVAGEPARELAEALSLSAGFAVPPHRRELWRELRERVSSARSPEARLDAVRRMWAERYGEEGGTVGAVALDARGTLAAATSTGGLAVKLPGRVGDSAVVGAGTFAAPWGAASATGVGEEILRAGLARRAVELARRRGAARAAREAVARMREEACTLSSPSVRGGAGIPGLNRPSTRSARSASRPQTPGSRGPSGPSGSSSGLPGPGAVLLLDRRGRVAAAPPGLLHAVLRRER